MGNWMDTEPRTLPGKGVCLCSCLGVHLPQFCWLRDRVFNDLLDGVKCAVIWNFTVIEVLGKRNLLVSKKSTSLLCKISVEEVLHGIDGRIFKISQLPVVEYPV